MICGQKCPMPFFPHHCAECQCPERPQCNTKKKEGTIDLGFRWFCWAEPLTHCRSASMGARSKLMKAVRCQGLSPIALKFMSRIWVSFCVRGNIKVDCCFFHTDIQNHLLKKFFSFPVEYMSHFCWERNDHICVGVLLEAFRCTDLDVYPVSRTTLFLITVFDCKA